MGYPGAAVYNVGQWNEVFRNTLGHAERSLVSELRDVRNSWAHQQAFSSDDAYRALDSIEPPADRRLRRAGRRGRAQEAGAAARPLRRAGPRARRARRPCAADRGPAQGGLKPWREVVTPHPDVATGRYQQAEFAADLGQVHRGEGADEYRDPREFFRRTYLTEGLQASCSSAPLRRLAGTGGDPVVELQTNFGGGKTHSMLALYHLFSGTPRRRAGRHRAGAAGGRRAQPAQRPARRAGGHRALARPAPPPSPTAPIVRTLWGELAWQLGGSDGYDLVAEADRHGVSPGPTCCASCSSASAPCLILIDEWVAYARQLHGMHGLPAGTFDTNFTFAQALTEAAKAVPADACWWPASPPPTSRSAARAGREALDRLQEHLRPRGVLLAAGQRRGGLRDRAPPALRADHRAAAASPPATPWSAPSPTSTARSSRSSRPSAARPTTSGGSRPPTPSTPSSSTGSTTTGPPWTSSSAPAACCA